MDGSNDLSGFKYPSTDPEWSGLNLLLEAVTETYDQEQRMKIREGKKPMEIDTYKVIKEDGFPKEDASKKPVSSLDMDGSNDPSSFKYPLIDPKWSNFNLLLEVSMETYDQERRIKISEGKKARERDAYEVIKEDGFPKEDASKKPIRFLDYAFEGASSSSNKNHIVETNSKEHDHVPKLKKKTGLKRPQIQWVPVPDDEENFEVLDEEWVLDNEENVEAFDQEWISDDGENVDALDKEWAPNESLKKKRKRSKGGGSSERHNPTQPLSTSATTDTTLELPQEFKNKISELGGTDITLIIQKSLFPTDLNPNHNRLSIPLNQIKNGDFLREADKNAIEVPLIQPSLELTRVTLAKWDMRKPSGSVNSSYVLRSTWLKVAKANQLKPDDVVQVWSFRVHDKLHLALVKV